jgi:hypothetical protein
VPLLFLGPPFLPIIVFLSTGMTGISLHTCKDDLVLFLLIYLNDNFFPEICDLIGAKVWNSPDAGRLHSNQRKLSSALQDISTVTKCSTKAH